MTATMFLVAVPFCCVGQSPMSESPDPALNRDALRIDGSYELVYIDTPYVKANGAGVNYRDFYHFLEGLVDYADLADGIDWSSKHRRLIRRLDPWSCPSELPEAFDKLFARFTDSILVVSYRSDWMPSIEEIRRMLKRHKQGVGVVHHDPYQYALTTNKRSQKELLIVA